MYRFNQNRNTKKLTTVSQAFEQEASRPQLGGNEFLKCKNNEYDICWTLTICQENNISILIPF